MLKLLQRRRGDADEQGFGLGLQVAGTLSLQAEQDLTHAGYLLLSDSILGLLRFAAGRANPAQHRAVMLPARP
ncbi:hypothetical protein LBMAG41_28040 [Cyanobium sp.]|nr:hypothetical protein LBMAG41_28040 [Cyanobium sp.]